MLYYIFFLQESSSSKHFFFVATERECPLCVYAMLCSFYFWILRIYGDDNMRIMAEKYFSSSKKSEKLFFSLFLACMNVCVGIYLTRIFLLLFFGGCLRYLSIYLCLFSYNIYTFFIHSTSSYSYKYFFFFFSRRPSTHKNMCINL